VLGASFVSFDNPHEMILLINYDLVSYDLHYYGLDYNALAGQFCPLGGRLTTGFYARNPLGVRKKLSVSRL
jgi:hypothetical protein